MRQSRTSGSEGGPGWATARVYPTTTVDSEAPLTRALATMIDTGFKSLPVLQAQRLVGIVAREDVLSAIQRAAEGQRPE
jgi:CBS-domain-containing membrane protein